MGGRKRLLADQEGDSGGQIEKRRKESRIQALNFGTLISTGS